MADIKAIAEALCGMTDKEAEKIAAVLKEEYGIEPASKRYELKTGFPNIGSGLQKEQHSSNPTE